MGIRASTTVIAVLVVAVSVGLAGTALVVTARTSLIGQISNNAEARAQDIALLAKSGSVPDPIPGRGEDLLVQVVDGSGTVVASSASIEGQVPVVRVTVTTGETRTYTVPSLADGGDNVNASGEGGADTGIPFFVVESGAKSPTGPVTVIVAASLNPAQQLADVLVPRLVLGLPLIVSVVGLTVWWLTGRALRPVDAIRAQAEEISLVSLGRRVPEPDTADEVGRLARTMNRMLDRLESAAVSQRRFISDASHELKSPVASIRTMLDVARRQPPDDLEQLLDDLETEDVRLEELVADMLMLARAEESPAGAHLTDVDLDDVVLAVTRSVKRRGTVGIDLGGLHPVRLHAPSGAIESLVRNLVDNAVRYAEETVWVGVESLDGEAVLTVSDDGPGIPEKDRERIFERFVRLDESRRRESGGTGLGLAVCRAVARSLGGDVRVAEPVHGGATLEARLPLATRG